MRLFVSVGCDGLETELENLQCEFEEASGLDFVPPRNVHLTLSFLGEVEEGRFERVRDAIGEAVTESDLAPFCIEFGGIGAFPSPEYIRVLWVGVREGTAELTRLHERIETRTVELGFEPDSHEFTPHATIARMRNAGGKGVVQRGLETLDPTLGTRTVDGVRLTESTLTDEGSEYETIARFDLRG